MIAMKLKNIITSSLFQILSFIFVIAYLLGILNIHFSDKNNYCVMTYMFEYPQYVRISIPENKLYPQYGLHAYSEGRFTEKARNMWFDGVPVLFIPGNSGSHMQARSLASVALRKAVVKGYEYHFDFFTISYNEEMSGIYGGVLYGQTKFAAGCINKILSLYRSNRYTKSVPTTVVLIGHSMGGLIAKRLLAFPNIYNVTTIAITLAAPLEAPVMNTDISMNDFYVIMQSEWDTYVYKNEEMKQKKLLISFGSGPRDILVPSGLTSSKDSFISALTTAVPGVWVSSDHVGIVWCKQLVMAINKYLFDIVDQRTKQITEDRQLLMSKALQYFQANRSMILNPNINRPIITMLADAFWYEDNRRNYHIAHLRIDKTTYLMIRLVSFPQNRFVAIESVNVDDKDWIFGCDAKFTYNTYRYCKQATSLTELSRWTGAATDFGKRKLATIHLHSIMEQHPDWSHVVVKVSPTRKPVVLNVDINDLASRQITVDLPSVLSFDKTIIKQETESNTLYYELILPNFNAVHQAYLLYVEPTSTCKAINYHVSAELHVPWAKNHEYYHYFTHLKQTPMKLRIFKTDPNITLGYESSEHVKITLLLDPQCQFTISIQASWYHRLAQFVRHYTQYLVAYAGAILLLAVRSNILNIHKHGTCLSMHSALMSEEAKPYYALVFGRLGTTFMMSVPYLSILCENANSGNHEFQYFTRSLLVFPVYIIAFGMLNIAVAVVLGLMISSSQLAHRLFFRMLWRGGNMGITDRVGSALQKAPMVVSVLLATAVSLSCGTAALVVGGAFYGFRLSKMYEEYLEDYLYKLMMKTISRMRCFFKSKRNRTQSETSLLSNNTVTDQLTPNNPQSETEETNTGSSECAQAQESTSKEKLNTDTLTSKDELNENTDAAKSKNDLNTTEPKSERSNEIVSPIDEQLSELNFHTMMFFIWVFLIMINMPALLTWARNYKYSVILWSDTSFYTGVVLSSCSVWIWQIDGPRKNLRYYEHVASLIFALAVFTLVLGPASLAIVNYIITATLGTIILQQVVDMAPFGDNESDDEDDDSGDKPKVCRIHGKRINISNTGVQSGKANNGLNKASGESNNASGESNNASSGLDKASSESNKASSGSKNASSGLDNASSESNNISNEPGTYDNNKSDIKSNKDNECDTSNVNNTAGEYNENRIYDRFKNLREKFNFNEDT